MFYNLVAEKVVVYKAHRICDFVVSGKRMMSREFFFTRSLHLLNKNPTTGSL